MCAALFTSCSDFAMSLQKNKDEVTYNLQILQASNGTVTASKTTGISAGDEVILTVTVNQGYQLKSLSVMTLQNKDVAVAAVTKNITYKFTMPASDVTVTPVFAIETVIEDLTGSQNSPEDNGVLYKVEHYLQTLEDLETYELAAIQIKSGEAGEDTTANAKTYAGFNVLAFAQKTISENGNTIVKIFYNRKIISYSFTATEGAWKDGSQAIILSGLYETKIDKDKLKKAGYTVTFDSTVPDYFGSDDKTYIASIKARTDTLYTIRIYYQNTTGGDNYYLSKEFYLHGTTDASTNYDAESLTGFTIQPYEQKIINGDESSVINIYYDRIPYTVTYELNGGSGLQSEQLLYGASPSQIPVKEGYTFYDWYYDNECNNVFDNIITQDTTLYAFWQDNSFSYQFTDTVIRLPGGTDGTAGPEAEYVLFGDYPQSLLQSFENIIIDETKNFKIGNLTAYFGSDNHLYVKKLHDKGGIFNYYRIEPIKWRIISKDENGKTVLFAEYELEKSKFAETSFDGHYENSIVHNFLNHDFLVNAFTPFARNKIEETEISLRYPVEEYPYFLDWYFIKTKVYLLTETELRIPNFTWDSFEKKITSYAYNKNSNSDVLIDYDWYLRDIDYEYHDVGDYGVMIYTNTGTYVMPEWVDAKRQGPYGVVPAITVYLPD